MLLLDQGVEAVKRFILSGHDSKAETGQFSQVIDYKTRSQELLQVHACADPIPSVSESGPARRQRVWSSWNERQTMESVMNACKYGAVKQPVRSWNEEDLHVSKKRLKLAF